MPDLLVPLMLLVFWVSLGLLAAVYLGRSGRRSPGWFAIGVVMGPLLLPVAVEVAQRGPQVLVASESSGPRATTTALAAIDGSRESEKALEDAAEMLTGNDVQFILVAVLDPDIGEHDPYAARAIEADLREHAATLTLGDVPPAFEVLAGDPAKVILERASRDDIDVIVLGRRGKGLTQMIMGSVADQVVRRSPRPVLLGSAPGRSQP